MSRATERRRDRNGRAGRQACGGVGCDVEARGSAGGQHPAVLAAMVLLPIPTPDGSDRAAHEAL